MNTRRQTSPILPVVAANHPGRLSLMWLKRVDMPLLVTSFRTRESPRLTYFAALQLTEVLDFKYSKLVL